MVFLSPTLMVFEKVIFTILTAVLGVIFLIIQIFVFFGLFSFKKKRGISLCENYRTRIVEFFGGRKGFFQKITNRNNQEAYLSSNQFLIQKVITLVAILYTSVVLSIYLLLPFLPIPYTRKNDKTKLWFYVILPRIFVVFNCVFIYLLLSLWFIRILLYNEIFTSETKKCYHPFLEFIYYHLLLFGVLFFVIIVSIVILFSDLFVYYNIEFLWVNEFMFHVVSTIFLFSSLVIILDIVYLDPKLHRINKRRISILISRFKVILPLITMLYALSVLLFLLWKCKLPPFKCLRFYLPFQTNRIQCWEVPSSSSSHYLNGNIILHPYITLETFCWIFLFHLLPITLISVSFCKIGKREKVKNLFFKKLNTESTASFANTSNELDRSSEQQQRRMDSFGNMIDEEMYQKNLLRHRSSGGEDYSPRYSPISSEHHPIFNHDSEPPSPEGRIASESPSINDKVITDKKELEGATSVLTSDEEESDEEENNRMFESGSDYTDDEFE